MCVCVRKKDSKNTRKENKASKQERKKERIGIMRDVRAPPSGKRGEKLTEEIIDIIFGNISMWEVLILFTFTLTNYNILMIVYYIIMSNKIRSDKY